MGNQRLLLFENSSYSLDIDLNNLYLNNQPYELKKNSIHEFDLGFKLIVGFHSLSYDIESYFKGHSANWVYIGISHFETSAIFDGPVVVGSADKIISYISPSQFFNFSSDFQQSSAIDLESFSKEDEIIYSISKYLQWSYPRLDLGAKIKLAKTEPWKAGLVVLLRKISPNAYFEILDDIEDKKVKPYWRRLFQNLGMVCDKAPRKSISDLEYVDLECLAFLREQVQYGGVLSVISGPSEVIPIKLR